MNINLFIHESWLIVSYDYIMLWNLLLIISNNNVFPRQILVTVPQCLEILFLSPNKQDWTKNVKYVIFDEVKKIDKTLFRHVGISMFGNQVFLNHSNLSEVKCIWKSTIALKEPACVKRALIS